LNSYDIGKIILQHIHILHKWNTDCTNARLECI